MPRAGPVATPTSDPNPKEPNTMVDLSVECCGLTLRNPITPLMTLATLDAHLAAVPDVGSADYSDEGMLQFLRTERVIPPYQTRGYKLVELVRIYQVSPSPR